MAQLIRVGLEVDSSQAEAGTRKFAQTMESGAQAVDRLQDRLNTLQQRHRLGVITTREYDASLRTLRADMQELASTTRLGVADTDRLAQANQRATQQIRQMEAASLRSTNALRMATMGVAGFAGAAQGGVAGVASFAAGLASLGRGSPLILGITLGLTAVAELWKLISQNAREAREEQERAINELSSRSLGRLRGNLESNLARQRRIRAGIDSGNISTASGDVLDAAAQLGIGRLQRVTTDMNRLADIVLGKLAEEESQIRGALALVGRSQSDTTKELERQVPFLERQVFLIERMVAARRDAATERTRMAAQLMGGREPIQPLPMSDFDQGTVDFQQKVARQASQASAVWKTFGKEAKTAADETAERWLAASRQIEHGLTGAFEDVLLRQRSLWRTFFDFIRRELARLLAMKAAAAVVDTVTMFLPGGNILNGNLQQVGRGAADSGATVIRAGMPSMPAMPAPGRPALAAAPVASMQSQPIVVQTVIQGQGTQTLVSSMTYETDRARNRGAMPAVVVPMPGVLVTSKRL